MTGNEFAQFGSQILNAGIGGMFGVMGKRLSEQQTKDMADYNYMLNEKSADAADKRTRALYEDYMSPSAMLEQYLQANLSPSLMFGGGGVGGASMPNGAQGEGASGLAPRVFTPLEAAQTALTVAQTDKIKAETNNVKQDTKQKEIKTELDEMMKNRYKVEFELMTGFVINDDGSETSLYDLAQNFHSYDAFYKHVSEIATGNLRAYIHSEAGNQILRSIFIARNQMERDINVLSEESVNAKFQESIVKAMKDTDFAKMNAESAIAYLKQNIQTAELTATQKEAWNNLINKLGKKDTTWRDIVIVLGMIVNNAASNWKMPSIVNNNNY